MGIPNAEAYPSIVFVIILSSVIITTIGLASAKKIKHEEALSGGFVYENDPKKSTSQA